MAVRTVCVFALCCKKKDSSTSALGSGSGQLKLSVRYKGHRFRFLRRTFKILETLSQTDSALQCAALGNLGVPCGVVSSHCLQMGLLKGILFL